MKRWQMRWWRSFREPWQGNNNAAARLSLTTPVASGVSG